MQTPRLTDPYFKIDAGKYDAEEDLKQKQAFMDMTVGAFDAGKKRRKALEVEEILANADMSTGAGVDRAINELYKVNPEAAQEIGKFALEKRKVNAEEQRIFGYVAGIQSKSYDRRLKQLIKKNSAEYLATGFGSSISSWASENIDPQSDFWAWIPFSEDRAITIEEINNADTLSDLKTILHKKKVDPKQIATIIKEVKEYHKNKAEQYGQLAGNAQIGGRTTSRSEGGKGPNADSGKSSSTEFNSGEIEGEDTTSSDSEVKPYKGEDISGILGSTPAAILENLADAWSGLQKKLADEPTSELLLSSGQKSGGLLSSLSEKDPEKAYVGSPVARGVRDFPAWLAENETAGELIQNIPRREDMTGGFAHDNRMLNLQEVKEAANVVYEPLRGMFDMLTGTKMDSSKAREQVERRTKEFTSKGKQKSLKVRGHEALAALQQMGGFNEENKEDFAEELVNIFNIPYSLSIQIVELAIKLSRKETGYFGLPVSPVN